MVSQGEGRGPGGGGRFEIRGYLLTKHENPTIGWIDLREQLELSKVVRDGFLIIVAGPGNEEGEEEQGEREGRVGLRIFKIFKLI